MSSASIGRIALHRIGSAELEIRECSDGFVEQNSAMDEKFLKLCRGLAADILQLSMWDLGCAQSIRITLHAKRCGYLTGPR